MGPGSLRPRILREVQEHLVWSVGMRGAWGVHEGVRLGRSQRVEAV